MNRFVLIDGDLSFLLNRLKAGQVVKGRIVHELAPEHYLLRLYGHNLVMKSPLKFKRLQEVLFKVVATSPKISLRVLDAQRDWVLTRQERVMDILID
jgi:hypothetical protein